MDNATRRQLLEQTKQAQQEGFKGSIMDVYNNPQILQQQSPVAVANTPQQQSQGLRGVERQNAPQAMVFPNLAPNTPMNTKGMKFNVDMDMYDPKGHLMQSYKNVPPGVESLPTGPRGATVVERPTRQTGGATHADSLFLLNKVQDLYRNLDEKNFTVSEGTKKPILNQKSWETKFPALITKRENSILEEMEISKRNKHGELTNEYGDRIIGDDLIKRGEVSDYWDNIDNKFYGTPDWLRRGGDDMEYPMTYIHQNIKPHSFQDNIKNEDNFSPSVAAYMYDPLLITPDDRLSPKELAKKYDPNYIPNTSINKSQYTPEIPEVPIYKMDRNNYKTGQKIIGETTVVNGKPKNTYFSKGRIEELNKPNLIKKQTGGKGELKTGVNSFVGGTPIQDQYDDLITINELGAGNSRTFTDDNKHNTLINKMINKGTHGYNPKTGALIKLDTPLKGLSKEEEFMGTRAYAENVASGNKGFTSKKQDAQIKKLPKEQQEKINAANYNLRRNLVGKENQKMVQNPLYYAPGAIAATATGLPALVAAGEATFAGAGPSVAAAWNTSIPGLTALGEGATIGNAINAGFATHGAMNIGPNVQDFVEDPSWEGAGKIGMNALEIAPVVGPAFRTGVEGLSAAKNVGKNAYKLNPLRKNKLGFRNEGDTPHFLRGFEKPVTPSTIDMNQGFDKYAKTLSNYKNKLLKLQQKGKIKNSQVNDMFNKFKDDLNKSTPIGEELGFGIEGTVSKFRDYPKSVIKFGQPNPSGTVTPDFIERMSKFRADGNIAVPVKAGKPFNLKGESPYQATLMDNLSQTDKGSLPRSLSDRDKYASLLKQTKRLQDSGARLDLMNSQNLKFNSNKNNFDIYDLSNIKNQETARPYAYMSSADNKLKELYSLDLGNLSKPEKGIIGASSETLNPLKVSTKTNKLKPTEGGISEGAKNILKNKDVAPNANDFSNITEVNPFNQAQARIYAQQGEEGALQLFEEFSEGANTLDKFKTNYLKDLTSPEGVKRLIAQERKALEKLGYPKRGLERQSEANAEARIGEIKNIINKNQEIVDGKISAKAVADNNYNFNNASYQSAPLKDIYMDQLWTPKGLNYAKPAETRIGGIEAPGKANLGTMYKNSVPTAAHEIGGHGLQAGRTLNVDVNLQKLKVTKDGLNAQGKKDYKYFLNKREPSPFLHEAREAMLEVGLIKSRHQYISPEKLKIAKLYFNRKPFGTINTYNKKFASDTRILDFADDVKQNWELLSREINALPGIVPGAIGTGVATGVALGSTKSEKTMKTGGYKRLPRY